MMPEISALLTTYNRAHLLPRVLQGLAEQRLSISRFEIVAIDDGSSDTTPQVLSAWQDRLPLRIVRQQHAGLAAAKNLGLFVARAPIIVFLDDDDVAEPDLLLAHLATHLANPDPAVAVLGYTTLAPEIGALPVMHHVTQVGCQLFSYGWMKPGQFLDYKAFWGGRSSCKRSLLVQHGIFQPDFQFGCEDIELGWRLASRGLRVIYQPRAHAVMIRALSFNDFCARSYRQGRSQYRFARLHDVAEVHAYCEIDSALAAWSQHGPDYAAHLAWAGKMDRLANAWQRGEIALDPRFQQTLGEAYRQAFFLSRAKGVADAASDAAS
ncbi:glycosyltransferase family 2 protein, partial [Thiomonas sp. FB-Cd]|uniref:glycosyltransferase family 2 protein n=1 Tax=Thiomonas sp. FB-Cd TaxID=1158292 RepID=UPI0004DF7BAC